MAKITIRFQDTTPPQRRKMLRDLAQRVDEHESLAEVLATLQQFEDKYGMSTVEFYAGFVAGKMGDARDFIKWAGAFQSYTHLLRTHFQPQSKVA